MFSSLTMDTTLTKAQHNALDRLARAGFRWRVVAWDVLTRGPVITDSTETLVLNRRGGLSDNVKSAVTRVMPEVSV